MNNQPAIREEELKNRVATVYFGRFECRRIVGNIDFCVSPKRRPRTRRLPRRSSRKPTNTDF